MKRLSLKYRIALTIFVLEIVMVALILWQTQRISLQSSQEQIEAQEEVTLSLLSDLGRYTLITSEFSDFQPYLEKVKHDPHVINILLADYRNIVVVSTKPSFVGLHIPPLRDKRNTYWRSRMLSTSTGDLGKLAIEFSNGSHMKAHNSAWRLGIAIASISMIIIALVGIASGHMLTRRLAMLTRASKRVSEGDFSIKSNITGYDEVAQLSTTFNEMVSTIKLKMDELERTEARFHDIADNIKEVFWLFDWEQQKVLYASPAYEEIWGKKVQDLYDRYEEWAESIHPNDQTYAKETFASIIKTGGAEPREYRIIQPDGGVRWISDRGFVIKDRDGNVKRITGIAEDITGRKKLEEQLLHAQKMEAVGLLAGGVAHDFNNILTTIIGYGNIMQMKMNNNDPARANLDNILAGAEKAAHLTQRLLAFSRKQIIETKPVDLNAIVRDIEKILSRVIGEDIELTMDLTPGDVTIAADRGQIEQILMNLATNARDSMPDRGQLSIETEQVEINSEFKKTHGYGRPGRYALLTVSDTGEGIDEEMRERIFEPFFTSKEIGKGTGLGLSITYSIVKQHNGYITVSGASGKGTTFQIYLPLTHEDVEGSMAEEEPAPKGGKETVLVAEDDAAIRQLLQEILTTAGYTVLEAEDGDAALHTFMKNPDEIQMLVSDVIMPKKNGKDLYDEIKKINYDVKALFISGYAGEIIQKKGILEDGVHFVYKPISPNDLLLKMREVLDG